MIEGRKKCQRCDGDRLNAWHSLSNHRPPVGSDATGVICRPRTRVIGGGHFTVSDRDPHFTPRCHWEIFGSEMSLMTGTIFGLAGTTLLAMRDSDKSTSCVLARHRPDWRATCHRLSQNDPSWIFPGGQPPRFSPAYLLLRHRKRRTLAPCKGNNYHEHTCNAAT